MSDLSFEAKTSEKDGRWEIKIFSVEEGPRGVEKVVIAASEGFAFSSEADAITWANSTVGKWIEDHLPLESAPVVETPMPSSLERWPNDPDEYYHPWLPFLAGREVILQMDKEPISARWSTRNPDDILDEVSQWVESKRWRFVRLLYVGDWRASTTQMPTLQLGRIEGTSHVHEVLVHREEGKLDEYVVEVMGDGWKHPEEIEYVYETFRTTFRKPPR
jgi:hypothetical protein